MNEALALKSMVGLDHIGAMLATPVARRSGAGDDSPDSPKKIVRELAEIVDHLVSSVIQKRSSQQFMEAREEIFPMYFRALRALADIISVVIPVHVRGVIESQSFSEREAEFRENALAAFGSEVRDQALFSVWTLRRISELCREIDCCELPAEHAAADQDLHAQFGRNAVSARFHMDCLMKAMEDNITISREVLPVLIEGLRSTVDAYAYVRRAYDLRIAKIDPPHPEPVLWDDEDQALLREATYDFVAED